MDKLDMHPWQRSTLIVLRYILAFIFIWAIHAQFSWSEFIVISPVFTMSVATEQSGIVLTTLNLFSNTGVRTTTSLFFAGEYVAPRENPPGFGFLHFVESKRYLELVCIPGLRAWSHKQSKRDDKTFALFIGHPLLAMGALTAYLMYKRRLFRRA